MKNLTAMKWIWPLQLTIKRLKRRKEETISSKKYTRSPVRADPVTGTLSDWTQHVAIPKGWFLWIWKEKPELQEQAAPKMCQPVFLLELCMSQMWSWPIRCFLRRVHKFREKLTRHLNRRIRWKQSRSKRFISHFAWQITHECTSSVCHDCFLSSEKRKLKFLRLF